MLAVILSALWLGILTAISPCPLATNIAAISFIGRKSGQKSHVIGSGLIYAAGRTAVYMALGMVIMAGMLGISEISLFLQKYINEVLGPILILLGLVLLGWLGASASLQINSARLQEKARSGSIFWAAPLGMLFALSFCPVSAGLFFGGLIPLAIKSQSSLLIPAVYGIGTALPVVVFAFIIAFMSSYVGNVFNRLSQIELWVRYIAGTAFILAGIYYCLIYIYGIHFN
jgi:cytochrome c biogenesis protein CcdA